MVLAATFLCVSNILMNRKRYTKELFPCLYIHMFLEIWHNICNNPMESRTFRVDGKKRES